MIYKRSIDLSIKELIYGSSLIFSIRLLSILGTYIFIFLISRYFGAESLGLFSLVQSLLYIISVVVCFGLDVLSVRLVSKYSYDNIKSYFITYKKIISIVLFFGIFLTIVLNQSAFFISSSIFKKPESYFPIKYFSFCLIPLAITTINAETFRGLRKVKHYSLYNRTSFLFYSSIMLTVILFLFNYKNYFLHYYVFIIVCIIGMIASTLNILRVFNSSEKSKKNELDYSIKDLLILSNPMMVTNVLLQTLQWSSIIFLGIFNPSSDVAVFTLVIKISSITSLILTSINGIAAPKISELYNDNKNLKKLIKNITQLTFITSFPILLFVLILYPYILNLFGPEYLIGKYALFILLFGQFFNISLGSVVTILNMTNKQKIVRNIIFFGLFINIFFNIIFIPKYGINGAAIATSLGLITWNILGAYFVYKELHIKSYIRK